MRRKNQKPLAFVSAKENEICLELLYHELKGRYIDGKTTLKRFVRLFSGKKVNTRVDWIADKNELQYMILRLLELGAVVAPKHRKWQCTAQCFTVRGEEIDPLQIRKTTALISEVKRERLDEILLCLPFEQTNLDKKTTFPNYF